MTIETICVFCGSRAGNKDIFMETAKQVGTLIGKSKKKLVFGAGGVGLMGAVAQSALDAGGYVIGVIPDFLKQKETPIPDLQEVLTVDTMHTRKRIMYDRSDAFIILPGGLGTLDELVEIVTWFQLELHNKPVYLLNIEGYWDNWFRLIGTMAQYEFVSPESVDYFTCIESIDSLENILTA